MPRYPRAPHKVNVARLEPEESGAPVGALIVLGCRVGAHGSLRGMPLRRVERAASAFHDGLAPLVLLSGGRRWAGRPEARVMQEALVARGVPRERTLLELLSHTTRENARFSASLLARRGVMSVGLVTCDWHMPRAVRLFRAAGLEVTPLPAESPAPRRRERVYRRLRELLASVTV